MKEKYEAKENADMTLGDLKYRLEEEGVGYTLMHYCSYSDIKDKEARRLFGEAHDAIVRLEQYMENV